MKKTAIIILIIFICKFNIYGQISGVDHLLPAPEFVEGAKSGKGYYGKVFELLHLDYNFESSVSYTAIPAFSPEYAILIEITKNDSSLIIINTLSENYGYSDNKEDVFVQQKSKYINKKTAELLVDLLRKALALCEDYKPDKDKLVAIGLDGVNYYFSEFRNEKIINVCKTWSPKTYKMEKLVSIFEELKGAEIDNPEKLNYRIKELLAEFEK